MALDKSFCGTLPQWLFLVDFQPVTERKKKGALKYITERRDAEHCTGKQSSTQWCLWGPSENSGCCFWF